jgi:hypothetical protein
MGHQDLATTMRYFGILKKKDRRAKINNVWDVWAAKAGK